MMHTIVHGGRDALADLYAPDVVITNPFAPDGVPVSVTGNEELRTRMKAYEQLWSYDAVEDVTNHETADPEVVVVEFGIRGRITASGKELDLRFVNVTRIVDGLVTESRDYSDAVRAAALSAEIQDGRAS
jgi:ketosteroid isomerase-like protein